MPLFTVLTSKQLTVAFQFMCKFSTTKIFDRERVKESSEMDDEPYAIQDIILCMNSRTLVISGAAGYVIMYKFNVKETTAELSVIFILLLL